MPKLASDDARRVEEEAAKGGPEPVPEGIYTLQLIDVDVSDKEGGSGYYYWIWKFRILDEGYRGREMKRNTSLSPQAAGILGGMFEGYGVPADTHTDELVGRKVMGKIAVQPITGGSREGELGNEIKYLMPFDGEDTPLDRAVPTSLGGASQEVEDF